MLTRYNGDARAHVYLRIAERIDAMHAKCGTQITIL